MDRDDLKNILSRLKSGRLTLEHAMKELRDFPYHDLGDARVDSHRQLRVGMPEVIFCEGKSEEQITRIAQSMLKTGTTVLATRISETAAKALLRKFKGADHNRMARTVLIRQRRSARKSIGIVAVMTAGTADVPVAEEAAVTCEAMGCTVRRIFDVGVAGIHRLTSEAGSFDGYDVFIVVAGMEGALASVVGGLVGKPVIAVPTSIGYGASFGGLAALLSMLNSCSSGVTVVNIDSGYGAATAAVRILNLLGVRK